MSHASLKFSITTFKTSKFLVWQSFIFIVSISSYYQYKRQNTYNYFDNENNIANGYKTGEFGISDNITRQDLALMLYKYAVLKGYDLTATDGLIQQYADSAKVSNYAQNAMNWAITQGIMSGKGNKGEDISTFKLDPTGTATRAECASMMMKLLEKNK